MKPTECVACGDKLIEHEIKANEAYMNSFTPICMNCAMFTIYGYQS